ncbi:MAG: hypothetical protein IPH93_04325 [Saprospiraceae bacterium]|nr:hypothetical protein [Saprospiraceae bacterium]
MSGILKIYFCYRDVFFGEFTTTFFFIVILYLLGALCHCLSTGYLFFGILFNLKDSKRRTMFYESGEVKYSAEHPFSERIANTSNIEIIKADFPNCSIIGEENTYHFSSKSYLSDSDLKLLIDRQQSDEGKRLIALEGLKFQLSQIGKVPPRL